MKPLISSVRVETVGGHDRVQVWNRGGLAGTLMVCAGDGDAIVALLSAEPAEPAPDAPPIGRMPREPCQKCGEMLHHDPGKPLPFCFRCMGPR